MKKRILYFMLILFLMPVYAKAVKIDINSTGAASSVSGTCNTDICSKTENISTTVKNEPIDGIRVILMNNKNEEVDREDLWFTSDKGNFAVGSNHNNIQSLFDKYKTYDDDVFKYNDFLNKLTEEDVLTILQKMNPNYTLENKSYHYIVVEPIFVLEYAYYHDLLKGEYTFYFVGTPADIVNDLLSLNSTSAVNNGAKYFVYNDYSNCNEKVGWSVKAGCQNWNILKNYFNTIKLSSTYGPFTKTSGDNGTNNVDQLAKNYNSNIFGKGIIKISDYITKDCDYYKNEIISNYSGNIKKQKLIDLYRNDYYNLNGEKVYLDKVGQNNGLLNFNNPTCAPVSCNNNQYTQRSCTSTYVTNENSTDPFTADNISCYNDTITISNKTYYCLTDFNTLSPMEDEIKVKYDNSFTNSGRFFFQYDSKNPILYGYVHKHCFLIDYPKSIHKDYIISESKLGDKGSVYAGNYYDYVKGLNWQNSELLDKNNNLIENLQPVDTLKNSNLVYIPPLDYSQLNWQNITDYDWADEYVYVFKKTVSYTFKPIYIKNGSGEISYTQCSNCKNTAGIITKFPDKAVSSTTLKFDIELNNKEYSYETKCDYNVKQEIIKDDELQLEFRLVSTDSSTAFLNKDGTVRESGANWSDISDREQVLDKQNNSYNRTGEGPKYKIVLTSSTIKEIREHNKTNSYEDYNLSCKYDGEVCISNYLTTLSTKYGLEINTKKRECYNDSTKCS